MSRPKTKSPPIQFRVSLTAYQVLQARAQAHNQTVNQFVAQRIEASTQPPKDPK